MAVENAALNDFFAGKDVKLEENSVEENTDDKNKVSLEEYEELKKELNDTKSKLGASSAEAKRLYEKFQSVEPYTPILDLLKTDEGAFQTLSNYIQKGSVVQDSVKAELGLGEDFQYSDQEAINDPNSDSAKLFQKMMERTAKRVADESAKKIEAKHEEEKRRDGLKSEAIALKAKYNLAENELQDFLGKVNSYRLTLEDLFIVINKDKVQENLVNNIVKEKLGNGVGNRSLAATGSNEKNIEHNIMDAILSSDSGGGKSQELENFFKF